MSEDDNEFNLKCTLFHTTCTQGSLLGDGLTAEEVLHRSLQMWFDQQLFFHAFVQGDYNTSRKLVKQELDRTNNPSDVICSLESAKVLKPDTLAAFNKLCGTYLAPCEEQPRRKRVKR